MKKINLLVLPYRDSYFHAQFGPAVRDLQFIFELSEIDFVDRIVIINRPVSWPERYFLNKREVKKIETKKIKTHDITATSLVSPLLGRSWCELIYNSHLKSVIDKYYVHGEINILLDFLPIGRLNKNVLSGWFYWYDMIDNFTKHNRFSTIEKLLVKKKYENVSKYANLITSVSPKAVSTLAENSFQRRVVFPNRIFGSIQNNTDNSVLKYDFGFIGFVTNKLDIDFITLLSDKNYSIAIYGKIFDRKIKDTLSKIKNVHLMYEFKYSQICDIVATFKVGLMPYILEKSHDESPLKMYEYLRNNTPCLSSMTFELQNEYIINYNEVHVDFDWLFSVSKLPDISLSISENMFLKNQLSSLLKGEFYEN